MHNQFYSVKYFFISLLLSAGIGVTVNGQTMVLSVYNETTGGDGSTGRWGDIMRYTLITTNTTGENLTSSTIYGKIPSGTLYVAGSTTVNGTAVSDVNGRMPFGSGGLINSPTQAPGTIVPSAAATIEYYVQVGGNKGSFSNGANLQATAGSGTVTVKSNTVITSIEADVVCDNLFQATASAYTGGAPYRYIRSVNTTNGTGGTAAFYNGATGPCYDAVTGAALAAGSLLTDAQAMAYSPELIWPVAQSNRLYFINGTTNSPAQELCYVDMSVSTYAAYRFTGYPLEPNTASGYNINRMAFCADRYGYALTANNRDLIRFIVDESINQPSISQLGPLVNDVNNGSKDVLAETGGDLFGDGSGRMYLITDSRKLYMINPATRIATYLGTIAITIGTAPAAVTSVAADLAGNIYIGGASQYVYKVDLAAMTGRQLSSGTASVYKSGDYASCANPVLGPELNVTKTYANTVSGVDHVRAGDIIEYTIEVTNTGNINAALVKLFDAIPANSYYVAGSTTVNGVSVTDIGTAMPFSVSGGQYISSSSDVGIIKPGTANKVVVKFRIRTEAYTTICNQSIVTCTDGLGGTIYAYSDDTAQSGPQDATCFYSAEPLIAMKANKTFINTTGRTLNGAVYVLSGDPIEYTIEVTNTGINNTTDAKFYDAIPAYSHYVAGSTTMNGVPVTDVSGAMPFSVSGGTLINTSAQTAGIVAPGDANKVVIKFRVTTDALKQVCNQATISYTDANSIAKNVLSDNPTQSGTQDQTCFYSDGILGGRIAVNTAVANKQPNTELPALTESVKVQPNPFVKDLNLQIELPAAETIQVRLIDFYGRTVYTTSRNVGAGVNTLKVSVPDGLSRGVYVLEVLAGKNRFMSKKLIKQ